MSDITDNSKSLEYLSPNSPQFIPPTAGGVGGHKGSLSNHNIITPITDSEDYFIVNPLHKSADIITANEVIMLKNKLQNYFRNSLVR